MIKARISLILKNLLQELGETQGGLANRIGVTQSNLQGYLKGKNVPGIDVILRIAELAGITTDQLLKEGVTAFVQAYDQLIESLKGRCSIK